MLRGGCDPASVRRHIFHDTSCQHYTQLSECAQFTPAHGNRVKNKNFGVFFFCFTFQINSLCDK